MLDEVIFGIAGILIIVVFALGMIAGKLNQIITILEKEK